MIHNPFIISVLAALAIGAVFTPSAYADGPKSYVELQRELAKLSNSAKGSALPAETKIVVTVTEHISEKPEPKNVGYNGGGKLDADNEEFVAAVGRFMAAANP
jgi:hypothetical protein